MKITMIIIMTALLFGCVLNETNVHLQDCDNTQVYLIYTFNDDDTPETTLNTKVSTIP